MSVNLPYIGKSGLFGLLLVISLIQLAACQNGQSAPQPDSQQATDTKWQASLRVTGGLKGIDQQISVNHQGVAQFTNHRTNSKNKSQISITDLNSIAKLVKNYSPIAVGKSAKTPPCRDCFYYTINVDYDGNVNRQRVSDLSIDDNLRPLIGALKTISSQLAQQSKLIK